MNVSAQKVLNYVTARAKGSEEQPLRLGNVDFWHPVPGYPVGLCYNIPTAKWDTKAVQDALNKEVEPYWNELCQALQEA